MMTLKFRKLTIVLVIAINLLSAWVIAALSELVLRNGLVHYVAVAVFAGAAITDFVALGWFLGVALIQLWRHDERNKDFVAVNESDRLLVRSDGTSQFRELNEQATKPITVFVPSRRKHAVPLDSAQLDGDLFHRLVKGGNFHGREN